MQPHHDIKTLELNGYHGETIPSWPGRGDNSVLFDFPNLVTLHIQNCSELLYLPWQIGKLPYLKTLYIFNLQNMEYVMDGESVTLVLGEGPSFFPSLDYLHIYELPKLKGWWRRSEKGSHVVHLNDGGSSRKAHLEWVSSPCFPLLKDLNIKYCENLLFVPLCPQLEHLIIKDPRGELFLFLLDKKSIYSYHPSSHDSHPKSRELHLNNLDWLKSMSIEYSQSLVNLNIEKDERLERLGEVNEFPTSLLSSLRFLAIRRCPKLESMGGWLEHLSALEKLSILECPKVELDGMSWHNLAATLHSLFLKGLDEMEEMPEGMQYCTSLRFLTIWLCPKLKYLPKWMPKLTSLGELVIAGCSESLKEICQSPNGDDWPLIQHISTLTVE